MRTFLKWLEGYYDDDDGPSLDGEYWFDEDGGTMYADGDQGDMNHEGYVIDRLQRDIAEKAGMYDDPPDWDATKKAIAHTDYQKKREAAVAAGDEKEVEELDFAWNDDDYYNFLYDALPEFSVGEEEFRLADGHGDARQYAIKNWGWKRVHGQNIESWTLTPKDAKAIVSGLDDMIEAELGYEWDDNEEAIDNMEFYVYCYANNKSHDLTLGELKAMAGEAKPQYTHPWPQQPQQPQQQPQQQPTAQPLPTPQQQQSTAQTLQPQGQEDEYTPQQQIVRNRHDSDINQNQQAGQRYGDDQARQYLHPYYRTKKFPFADWVERNYGTSLKDYNL